MIVGIRTWTKNLGIGENCAITARNRLQITLQHTNMLLRRLNCHLRTGQTPDTTFSYLASPIHVAWVWSIISTGLSGSRRNKKSRYAKATIVTRRITCLPFLCSSIKTYYLLSIRYAHWFLL